MDVDEVDTAAADGVGDQGFDQGSQPGTRFRFAEQEPVDGINVVVDGDLKIEDVAVTGEELGLVGRVDVSEETGCGVSVELRSEFGQANRQRADFVSVDTVDLCQWPREVPP